MDEISANLKKPSLISAIAIGVGCIIGSGWLFASYYAAQYTGAASLISWVLGACISLCIALLLGEIASVYQQRGLFARIISISHHRDFGFVFAISNWLGIVITIPSESEATVQYLGTSSPALSPYIFHNQHLTMLGMASSIFLIIIYGLLNFWGIRLLTKANNIITAFKIIIPLLTVMFLFFSSYHAGNFTAYHGRFMPYGADKIFSAIVVCGIFYAFYGFSTITTFAAELNNPKRNIPIALVASITICLVIYLLLQTTFIGALPTHMIAHGWHNLNFTSPLAQLLILLNLNFWAVVLYLDAFVSPSGTAIIYTGSSTRMLTGMSEDRQMHKFFQKMHPKYKFSRRSLALSLIICILMVLLFRNWQKIMMMVTVFQLLTCIAVPLAFSKLRMTKKYRDKALFHVPLGSFIGFILFFILTYLLLQVGVVFLWLSLGLHIVLFFAYVFSFYKHKLYFVYKALLSSWSIFLYLLFCVVFGYFREHHLLFHLPVLISFFVVNALIYFAMLYQKEYG